MTSSEGTNETPSARAGRKYRCLVAENSPDTLELLHRQFEGAGYEVVMAHDGVEGLSEYWKAIKEGRPFDLIFTDLAMAHMDGVTMTKRIRLAEAESAEIGRAKIVGYTAYTSLAETAVTPEDATLFDGIFRKPDDSARIPELVAAVLKS